MRPCWIFDIDGTLADCSHRLHHITGETKDWRAFFAAVGDDKPIEHVAALVDSLVFGAEDAVVFLSGRSDECRTETLVWLEDHLEINPATVALYMRRAGDHRPDEIVKVELLAELRADGFEPIMIFEDRARVVKVWRSLGIPCAQVADGDF